MRGVFERVGGIHFKVLMLVTGLAATLLAVQLITNTIVETRQAQVDRLVDAQTMTHTLAREFETQFSKIELLPEIYWKNDQYYDDF